MNTQTEQGAGDGDEVEAAAADGTTPPRSRRRLYSMRALVILGSLILVVGSLAVWIDRVTLNPSTWSDTSGKVLENPAVQQALSTYLVDQVYNSVDVTGKVRDALPPRAKPLAAPVAAGLRQPLEAVALRALGSPTVHKAWRLANLLADRELVRLIDNKGRAVHTNGGAVTLDLRPIVQGVVGRLGLADRVQGRLPAGAGRIVLLRSDQLSTAQTGVRILRAVANLLVILVVLIFAAAVWVAPDRRRAVRACAIGLIVAGLVLVFVRRVLGDQLINRVVADESVRPAAHAIWWIATDPLHLEIESILFVGLVGLVGAWIAGHGTRATATRRGLAAYLRDPLLAFGALVTVVLALLAWAPTPAARNWVTVAILTALAALGLELLRRQTAREFPDAERGQLSLLFARRAPAAPPLPSDDARLDRLGRLAKLHTDGVLDDAEFAREKERVLAGSAS